MVHIRLLCCQNPANDLSHYEFAVPVEPLLSDLGDFTHDGFKVLFGLEEIVPEQAVLGKAGPGVSDEGFNGREGQRIFEDNDFCL